MKTLIIILLSFLLQSCSRNEEIVAVKEVDQGSIFTISGKTTVIVNEHHFEITFLRFEDYGTTGFQPPYTIVYCSARTDAGSHDFSIFHYLGREKMGLEKLDSISENESSEEAGFYH